MAKKARKKLEEEAEAASFSFPEFDEEAFVRHEFEQTIAMGFAVAVSILLAVLSFGLDRGLSGVSPSTLQWVLPVVIALAVTAFSPFLLQRLRNGAPDYTRGDWATVILLEVFGWIGFWFLLSDVFPVH